MAKRIVFLASYATDYTGVCAHLPREGETVTGDYFKIGPGGKGSNQAVCAHRLGADVDLIVKIGRDMSGDYAKRFYEQEQIRTDYLIVDEAVSSGVALIAVDRETKQNQILIMPGACKTFNSQDIEKARSVIQEGDIFMGQFEVNLDGLEKAMDIARKAGNMIMINPAPAQKVSDEFLSKIDIITPNETETEILTGIHIDSIENGRRAAAVFHKAGIPYVVITMGDKGVFASCRGNDKFIPAYDVEAVDTTGAGDAFNGALAAALSRDVKFMEAVIYANRAASIAVQRFGSGPSMPYKADMQ
ncbi:ribokinase [Luxibacter massiliensis]|uniref:ribokinase n=1 Tax=Luxibacter massiliensis TaxID=2219695 RepID=UPI0013E02C6B|nr:ribokinase [Luxibacter massiliensis]